MGSVLDNGYFWPGFIKRYGRWFRWRRVPTPKRAAVHDVTDRAGIIESQPAALDGRASRAALVTNIKNRPEWPLVKESLSQLIAGERVTNQCATISTTAG